MPADRPNGSAFRGVVIVTGHMIDGPTRVRRRFPPDAEDVVASALDDVLDRWRVDGGCLVVTAGARGADLIGAERAIDRGATVWLLPSSDEPSFIAGSVGPPGSGWEVRYQRVRSHGEVHPGNGDYAANNERLLDVADEAARPGRPRVLAVWDGQPGDGPGGTDDLVERARARGLEVTVLRPGAAG